MMTVELSGSGYDSIVPGLLGTHADLIDVHMLGFCVFSQSIDAKLTADAALFVTAKGSPFIQ